MGHYIVSKLFRAYGLYNVYKTTAQYTDGLVSKLFRAYGLYNLNTTIRRKIWLLVSKLFRAYGLYNELNREYFPDYDQFQSSFELTGYITYHYPTPYIYYMEKFQSSFELTGYITLRRGSRIYNCLRVSKLFRAYGLYNTAEQFFEGFLAVSKLFRAYGLYNYHE